METDILGKMSAETETGDKCHSVGESALLFSELGNHVFVCFSSLICLRVCRPDVKGANPGNPVFTCNQSSSSSSRDFVPESQTREIRSKKQHPMYTTSSGTYGYEHFVLRTE